MFKPVLLIFVLLMIIGISYAVPRDYVVVEVGTGTWCQYCPGAALGVDDMIANDLRAAVIEYHNGDTFTNTYSNARNNYYNITGFPTAFFDGGLSVVGGDHTQSLYSSYLPKYNQRMAVNSAFTIALEGRLEGSTYFVTATVNKVETYTPTNLYLRAALTESDIAFNWQGQSHLNFVERDMYPNATGTAMSFTSGNTQTVNFEFQINPAYVTNNCELVVFLQNNSTKEILQGTKAKIAGLVNAFPLNLVDVSFGDVVVNTSSTTQLVLNNYWNQTMSGTVTCDNPLVNINFPGRLAYSIPPFGVEYFNVTCYPDASGPLTGNIIITTDIPAYPSITVPFTANAFVDNAPSVSNVTLSGIPVIYQTLTGHYTFSDIDGDAEGTSNYQWYHLDGVIQTEITGQTQLTYTVQPGDIGKQIIFGVTPYDEHNIPGQYVYSPPSAVIEQLPAPQNLTAQVSGNMNVVLNWLPPNHFGRGLFGYKLYKNNAVLTTIANPATLTFTDQNLPNGTYEYHAVAIYNNPLILSVPSNTVTVEITNSTHTDDATAASLTMMQPAFPNPFNANVSSTKIKYNLASRAEVDVSIYDIRGRKVANLVHEARNPGEYQVEWNGRDANGNLLPSGVYQCRMNACNQKETRKVVLVK